MKIKDNDVFWNYIETEGHILFQIGHNPESFIKVGTSKQDEPRIIEQVKREFPGKSWFNKRIFGAK